jgi:2-phospho-L-lactate guanylyltransferase
VAVKLLPVSKTRLDLRAGDRADLALAMALVGGSAGVGTASVSRVLVISDDERARAEMARLGVELLHDEPDAGLNPALRHGIGTARSLAPGDGVAIVSSDVPTVTATELELVLAAAERHQRSYVSDWEGTGTTFLAALAHCDLLPHFGPRSAEAHAAAGCVALPVDRIGLRRDVDTLADLLEALGSADPDAAVQTRALAKQLGLLAG